MGAPFPFFFKQTMKQEKAASHTAVNPQFSPVTFLNTTIKGKLY